MLGMVWRWSSYQPSNGDLLLGLVVVPVLLIGGYFLLQGILRSMLASPTSSGVLLPKTSAAVKPQEMAPQTAMPQLSVLAGCVKLPVGGAQELMQACMEGVRPGLDAQLRDSQGFPVMAARVPELDDVDVLAWWDGTDLDGVLPWGREWLLQLPAAKVRELRLLADVLGANAVDTERELQKIYVQHTSGLTASEELMQSKVQLPPVHVRIGVHADWAQEHESRLQSWGLAWLQRSAPTLHFEVQVHPTEASDTHLDFPWPSTLLEVTDAALTNGALLAGVHEDVCLLAATYSGVSQAVVDQLEATGRLYGPKRREGWVVGEGAAALAVLRQPLLHAAPAQRGSLPFPTIASARACRAAEAEGTSLQGVLAPMLKAGETPAEEVAAVVSDADHLPASSMEMAMLLSQQLPHLSAEKDCSMVGVPCGYIAGVGALASLVLASELAAETQRLVLAATVRQMSWRAAALLMPPGWSAEGGKNASNAEA
jgi:hypothetical protein